MQVIICESRGQWAIALRSLLPRGVPLRESRSLGECEARLSAAATSLVVIELTASNGSQVIERIELWHRKFPASAIVVATARGFAAWRDLAMEAGALYFLTSTRDLADVVAILQRQRQRYPQPATATADRIWKELPFAPTLA